MAVARFQILTVLGVAPHGFMWRFLSANNRKLCHSVCTYPDVNTCLTAVQELRDQIDELEVVTLRDGPRRWAWRVRLADTDLAVSSRNYERWVEADRACALFLESVTQTANVPLHVAQF